MLSPPSGQRLLNDNKEQANKEDYNQTEGWHELAFVVRHCFIIVGHHNTKQTICQPIFHAIRDHFSDLQKIMIDILGVLG